jgi:hypothetical protein
VPGTSLRVGAFAQGFPDQGLLPHRDYPRRVYRVVLDACRVAWTRLASEVGDLGSATEDEITAALQRLLNAMQREDAPTVPGFTTETFERVTRGENFANYDGTRLDKQPDLRFSTIPTGTPARLIEQHAIFAECKIVDSAGQSVHRYCKDGLQRFVTGQYSWAMPSGLMLAYAREACSVPATLSPHLGDCTFADPCALATRALPAEDTAAGGPPRAWVSSHARAWKYRRARRAPGEIRVWHLWLSQPCGSLPQPWPLPRPLE